MKKRGSAPDFTPSIPPNHELPGLHSQNQRDICLLWCFRYLAAAAITKSRSKNICKPLCFRNNDQTLQQLISNINFIINEKMKKGSWIIGLLWLITGGLKPCFSTPSSEWKGVDIWMKDIGCIEGEIYILSKNFDS